MIHLLLILGSSGLILQMIGNFAETQENDFLKECLTETQ